MQPLTEQERSIRIFMIKKLQIEISKKNYKNVLSRVDNLSDDKLLNLEDSLARTLSLLMSIDDDNEG